MGRLPFEFMRVSGWQALCLSVCVLWLCVPMCAGGKKAGMHDCRCNVFCWCVFTPCSPCACCKRPRPRCMWPCVPAGGLPVTHTHTHTHMLCCDMCAGVLCLARFRWAVKSRTGCCQAVQADPGCCWDHVLACWVLLGCADECWLLLGAVCVRVCARLASW